MSTPSKKTVIRTNDIGLGLAASNPSQMPSYAKAERAAYDEEMREMHIAERDWRQRLEIIVAALRHFGYDVEISPSVPTFVTPYDWEIECHFERSYSDSHKDEDKLAVQEKAIADAHEKRLRSRSRRLARAIKDATTREGGVEGIVAKLSSCPYLIFKGKIVTAPAAAAAAAAVTTTTTA